MKDMLLNVSLRTRMLLSNIVVALIPFLIFSIVSGFVFLDHAQKTAEEHSVQLIHQVSNSILDGGDGEKVAAELYSPDTGIAMTVRTTMPGVQFYSGNVLDGPVGKSGVPYETNMGLCLETQYFPNAMSCPHFPSPVLHKGELYAHDTSFTFGCK